jgi:Xaa-Pro aminopeptidase
MKKSLEIRLDAIRKALDREHLSGLVINQPAYIFHITGWLPPIWAKTFAVIGPNDFILVAPFIPDDIQPTWNTSITYTSFSLDELINVSANAILALLQAVSQARLSAKSVGVILDALPGTYTQALSKLVQLHEVSELLHAETAVKDEMAQRAIRQRVGFLDQAFEVAALTMQPGMSEMEVFGAIYNSLIQLLGSSITLDCNFGSGFRTIADEPQPTNKRLKKGEPVLIDLFPMLGGYGADYTRNFAVKEATEGQLVQHGVLEKALSAAEAALRPGIAASEIDRIVRKVIEEEGYGKYAHQHHSGHAFGLAIPEPPWLIPADHTPLKPGMVIAIEPGIYHPVNGGMRLEGDYIITDDGYESLSGYPPKLTICK